MPSTFLGLNTGLSGLTYFQTALNTTAHNISNADTKGYSRQNVQASASDALRLNKTYGMMGTGITASAVERQRNAYYDTKYWSANSKYSQYNSQHANLEQLQTYMNEMTSEAGYTKWMAEMSDAMQDLSPYLHLLGGKKDALPFLKNCTLPVSHSLARLRGSGGACTQMAEAQLAAADFGTLCRVSPEAMGGLLRQKNIFLT